MRTTFTYLLLLLGSTLALGQETVKRSNDINQSITEKFAVLKSDKKVREGLYSALANGTVIASGQYANGSRSGEWQFFNRTGKPVQKYNYDTGKISIIDSGDLKQVKCYFAQSINKQDITTYAAKIGGFYYGLLPLMTDRDLALTIRRDNPGAQEAKLTHIFTVDAQGMLTKHEVLVTVSDKDKLYIVNHKQLNADLKTFYPATINNHPVECKLTAETRTGFYSVTTIR